MNLDTIITTLNELEKNGNYRFHFAKPSWDEEEKKDYSPLNAIARGNEEWRGWQIWKRRKGEKWIDRFPGKYVVSFAQINGERFLFGGIFEIISRMEKQYDIELKNEYSELIGRLVVEFEGGTGRSTTFMPEKLDKIKITELYSTRYTGEIFQSIFLINHDYYDLETIFKNQLPDWKSALSKVKGIYLLTDKSTGKHYIGSAYGEGGIWGRWSQYIYNYTGGNKELCELVEKFDYDYFKKNFKFSVLEVVGSTLTNDEIIQKETIWKEKILSKQYGYNSN